MKYLKYDLKQGSTKQMLTEKKVNTVWYKYKNSTEKWKEEERNFMERIESMWWYIWRVFYYCNIIYHNIRLENIASLTVSWPEERKTNVNGNILGNKQHQKYKNKNKPLSYEIL